MTWINDPIYALDTETTGTDPETASLLTCCLGLSVGVGSWNPLNWQANPGNPIPADATRVHGITDEQSAGWPEPVDVLDDIRDRLDDAAVNEVPIVGHNLLYDLTLIDREMRRHLGKPLPSGLIVLDTLVLFRRFDLTTGSRSLVQLAARHGITFPAHDAEADALASLRLLHILAADNDLLPHVDPQTLHHLQADWFAAQTLAAHYRRLGNGQSSEQPNTDWPIITNGDPV